eukprot:TRINITY_DN4064_c0_g1_i6.p1 TRINITY_DN4064_c0_g1~~TRINITY_DN4064_c0_g1_i6.p1  ORF type:complete len:136 (-),score=30.11 TRINITY_DN4064_c0_g1_i6:1385-1792(-)
MSSRRYNIIADLPQEEEKNFVDERDPLLIPKRSNTHDIQEAPIYSDPPEEVFREVILVSLPFFCGFACLNALQYQVKETLDIDDGSDEIFIFQVAVSMVAIGTFLFRLGQNVFLIKFAPRSRVVRLPLPISMLLG